MALEEGGGDGVCLLLLLLPDMVVVVRCSMVGLALVVVLVVLVVAEGSIGLRNGSSVAARAAAAAVEEEEDEARGGGGGGGGGGDGSDSTKDTSKGDLVIDEEEFNAITDKIPQRPMSVVEGTSYTLVIIAALGFAAAVLYAAFSELLFSPKEYTCYSKALARIEDDPRVTIRLGSPIHAYGTESRNRSARQRIPHRIYNDANGVEHVQLQFHAKGPSGKAVVHADMYKEGQEYKYHFLYLTVESPLPQQVVLIRPHQPDNE